MEILYLPKRIAPYRDNEVVDGYKKDSKESSQIHKWWIRFRLYLVGSSQDEIIVFVLFEISTIQMFIHGGTSMGKVICSSNLLQSEFYHN